MAGKERSTMHPPLIDSDRCWGGHGTNGSVMVALQWPNTRVSSD